MAAYRDFRENYQIEVFQTVGDANTPAMFARTEFPVAVAVVLAPAVFNVFRNHRRAVIGVYTVMACG